MDPGTKANLEQLSVATVNMQLLKRGIRHIAMDGVRPLNVPAKRIVGEAYTLRYIPLREDLSSLAVLGQPGFKPRRAIEETPENSVLVIDGRQRKDVAVLGDILIERLRVRGVAAVVSDGGVRDFEECISLDFPIYAAGSASPASVAFHSSGDLQCAIGCGGVAVIPGDIIVGNSDGVVVIPKNLADEISRDGLEQERYERFVKARVTRGRTVLGLYPPNEQAKAEYAEWLAAGETET